MSFLRKQVTGMLISLAAARRPCHKDPLPSKRRYAGRHCAERRHRVESGFRRATCNSRDRNGRHSGGPSHRRVRRIPSSTDTNTPRCLAAHRSPRRVPRRSIPLEQTRACSAVCDTAKTRCLRPLSMHSRWHRRRLGLQEQSEGKTRDLGRAGYRAWLSHASREIAQRAKGLTVRCLSLSWTCVTVPGEVFWRWLHDGSWEEALRFS